jgi:hypothetical protein
MRHAWPGVSVAVASLLIWDYLTDSTEGVYETITSALSCWFSLPGKQTTPFDTCSELMVNELISLLPYILFIYAMGAC